MKPYFESGGIRLYHGDCREVMRGLDLRDVGCTIADPPYGETSLEWDNWPEGWPLVVAGMVPTDASMWCFGSLRMFLDYGEDLTLADWRLAQDIVWEKHNGSNSANDRFRRVHELVTHWYRSRWEWVYKNPVTTPDAVKRQIRRKKRPPHWSEIHGHTFRSEDGGPRLARSVQYVRSTHGRAVHPTQKPLPLLDTLLQYSLEPGKVVLDPFAGSGSTLVAARLRGARAIGIEVQERYAEVAAKAISQELILYSEEHG